MEDRVTKEEWVVVWFPSDASTRQRTFRSEEKALDFAKSGVVDRTPVSDFVPLVEYRRVTTISDTKIIYNSADKA